jgi:uncharacterized membrane protein
VISPALAAIVCGFGAALAWGWGDFLGAKAARSGGPVESAIIANVVGMLGFGAYFLAVHRGGTWNLTAVLFTIAAGVAIGVGQLAFFQALDIGPVSLVSPLASGYPLVTTVLVAIFFQARLSTHQVAGVVAVALGAAAASELFTRGKAARRLGRGPALAIVTSLTWGVAYACLAQALKSLDWPTVSLIQVVVVVVVSVVLGPLLAGDRRAQRAWFRRPAVAVTGDRGRHRAGADGGYPPGTTVVRHGHGQGQGQGLHRADRGQSGYLAAGRGRHLRSRRDDLRVLLGPSTVGAGLLQMLGMVIINAGIGRHADLAPTVAALSSSYSALTILLALTRLDERPKLIPLAGAGLTIAGAMALALG